MPKATDLRPSLTLSHATTMVVGIIIGASIFVQPSEITKQMPSVSGIIAAWIGAGALTLLGALVAAELTSAFPRTGGVYVFLREAYGPSLGFLWGWAMFWSMHSGIVAAIATVFARYVAVFVPVTSMAQRAIAAALILLLSAINYAGVRHGGMVQNIFTTGKVLAIVVLIAAGLVWSGQAPPASAVTVEAVSARGFVLALAAGLFAYGGWHMVTFAAGEVRDAARTIPRALLLGTLLVTACYAGLNAIYLRVLPLDAVRASTHVAADAATIMFGTAGTTLVSALVLVSTFGAANGVILAGPRVYYSMARDGLIFRWFGQAHPAFGTPARAIALQAVWSAVLALTNTYGALFSRVVYTEWIFFAAMALGLMRLRRRADYRPTSRLAGYPFTALIFIAAALVVVVIQVLDQPVDSAIGLGVVLLGLPIYLVWNSRATKIPQ